MSAITVGGDLVHYEVLGRGRPVILLHGWIGSWRYWVPTMRQLHLKYRVYALDLFGYGDSAKNPQKYSVGAQVHLLDTFTKQLGIGKTALIGHGLGAQVALEYAQRYPDRVARLMLSGAPLFDPGNLEQRKPEKLAPETVLPPAPPPSRPVNAARPIPSLRMNRPLASKHPVEPDTFAEDITRPTTNGVPDHDRTIVSAANGTMVTAPAIDRERLRQAAQERMISTSGTTNPPIPAASHRVNNPLYDALNTNSEGMEGILARCFRRAEPEFDKLLVDVTRADDNALSHCAQDFDAGQVLDMLRLLEAPTIVVHGQEDPLIHAPGEIIWDYVTAGKDDSLLPFPLPGVRHFPMLEHDLFQQLVGKFLETPDISKIELKERWRRRSR